MGELSINRDDHPVLSKLPIWILRLLVLFLSPLVLIISLFTGGFIENLDMIVRIMYVKIVKVGGNV
jgi:antibiotic biosynthesis monooxygenase (ABM) superfamily enzyme